MIVRLIAKTLTPIVTKSRSRFLKIRRAWGVVSNRPYLDLEAPIYHRCCIMVVVKQGARGLAVRLRAQVGYMHLDFKAHTTKQAWWSIKTFLQLQWVDEFTTWGYGRIQWMRQKTYHEQKSAHLQSPRFRILKELPPNLSCLHGSWSWLIYCTVWWTLTSPPLNWDTPSDPGSLCTMVM